MREPRFWMKVWDAPVRLFHWAIVLLVATSYVTWRTHRMALHILCGETILALLLFRLGWGFIGSDTARFSKFLRSPLAALRHLARLGRREADNEIGHNAAGGWMVLLLLGLLLGQATSGLFAHNRANIHGPLAHLLTPGWSTRLTHLHAFTFNLILAAIGLHVLAVLAYAVLKRQNLLRPMITGRKRLPGRLLAPRMQSPLLAAALLALCGLLVWVLVTRI